MLRCCATIAGSLRRRHLETRRIDDITRGITRAVRASMKRIATILALLAIAGLGCTTPCNDGTRSWSHGSGTCSHHGGIRR